MGKIFTRADAWEDPNWIVDVTKNVLGASRLSALAADPSLRRDGANLRVCFWGRVLGRVHEYSDETLGRIIGYGGHVGFHTGGIPQPVTFINKTGYFKIHGRPMHEWLKGDDGRTLNEILAATTLLCVAIDIMMQSEWQVEVAEYLAQEGEYEQGLSRYIHGVTSAQI